MEANTKKHYNVEEYKATLGFFYLWIFLMLIILISILIGRLLNIPASIGVIWIVCLFILPFIFEKKIKQAFTKQILIEFEDLSFSIYTFNSKNEISRQINIKWSDIKSYKFYFSPAKNTMLSIYLKDGKIKNWGFKDNKTSKEAISGDSLFNIFHAYISQFNKNTNNRILLNRGFLNSKSGSILLYTEIFIVITGFIIHLIFQPQSSFLTFLVGFSLVIQQFLKRNQEKRLYDVISNLD